MADSATATSLDVQQYQVLINSLADQLCPAVDGRFDFKVQLDIHDEALQKLQLLVNFVLDAAQRSVRELTLRQQTLEKEIAERRRVEDALQASEKRFMDVMYASNDATLLISGETFVDCNEATVRMLGYSSRAEFLMKHPSELSPPVQPDGRPSLEKANEMMEIAYKNGFHRFEWTHRKANGEDFPVEVSLTPLTIQGKSILYCVWHDITDKKRAESQLQRTHALMRQIFESIPSVLIATDGEGRVTEWNRAAERVLGRAAVDAWGRTLDALGIGWDWEVLARAVSECHSTRKPVRLDDVRIRRRDGEERILGIAIRPFGLVDDSGRANMILLLGDDITKRRKAEEVVAETSRQQLELNRLQQDLLGPGDLTQKLKKITDAAVRLFDADFCRIWVSKRGDLCESGCIHAEVREAPPGCRCRDRCLHLLASSGRYTHTDGVEHRRVPFGCHKIGRVASAEDGKFLTNAVTTELLIHDHEWAQKLGLVSCVGYQLRPPGEETLGVMALFSKHVITPEIDALLESLAHTAAQVIQNAKAEEEQQHLQSRLLQAQRLESVGQLAAGIAHEINTPTQFVSDNMRFLRNAFPKLAELLTRYQQLADACRAGPVASELLDGLAAAVKSAKLDYLLSQIPEALSDSLDGLERVTKIVRAMKDFAHPGQHSLSPADLNKAIESTVTVARNEWKYVADVKLDLDPALPQVPCLLGDFNQVILNIVVNAAHAIKDVVGAAGQGKGTITISTRCAGDHVEIRIRDTGTGIPEAHRGRIFDHFFTTKPVGKGTGQGLAIARQVIVEKHRGTLTFETETGKGTTFIIRLPIEPEAEVTTEAPENELARVAG